MVDPIMDASNIGDILMSNITYKVLGGMKYLIEKLPLSELVSMGKPGVEGTEPEIDSASGFLQRLAQKIEWRKGDNKRAKAYLRSIVMGSGLLDAFVVVPAHLILASVKKNLRIADGEEKRAWEEVKAYVEERMDNGAKYFIIDGQNRLNEALVPMFTSKLAFGAEKIVIEGSDDSYINLAGKKFKDLPAGIQNYIDQIEIPFVIAEEGDIEQFSQALIWKNEGVTWDQWQITLQENWYTKFRQDINSIASKDNGDYYSCKALSKISGAKFAYDVNGFDLVVAQLLVWMDTKTQPKTAGEFTSYFNGTKIVKKRYLVELKRYLKEFAKKYDDKKPVTNVELRNYVMLRYALDHPNEFPTLAIPAWNVKDGVAFAGIFQLVNFNLMKKPEKFGELETYQVFKQGGRETKSKNPGSYVYYNSESKPDDLLGRLVILFNVMTNIHDKEDARVIVDKLLDEGIVVVVDDARMLSLEEIYIKNPNDSRGTPIPVSQLSSKKFDRGHKVAKSKGGKNDDLVIQDIRENRQTQDDYVA